jgi:Ser/Thr protein kinase RdoA (MazF antagonist)
MTTLRFRKAEVLLEIRKTFPKASINSFKRFSNGLVSKVYTVSIIHPTKKLAVKIYKVKHDEELNKNIQILRYLNKKNIPAPKIFTTQTISDYGIMIMELLKGENLFKIYKYSDKHTKKKLLYNSGKVLRKIHNLKIQKFWIHQKHEIKSIKEWKSWTNKRIRKYLKFAKKSLKKEQYLFLKREFLKLSKLLSKAKNNKFVNLHGDFHFYNLNATKEGTITGIYDFDSAMKGHNLGDIGQAWYWILLKTKQIPEFSSFLQGYSKKFSSEDKEIIRLYTILHAAAVMRTNWDKKRLRWLMIEHEQMLDRFMNGKYIIK